MPEPYLGLGIARLYNNYPSARQALAAYRTAGGRIRTQTFQALWREYGARQALAEGESSADLRFKPNPRDVLPITTRKAKGLMQEVLLYGRTRSGLVVSRRIEINTPRLRARGWMIRQAEKLMTEAISRPSEETYDRLVQILGGVHIGAYQRVPES